MAEIINISDFLDTVPELETLSREELLSLLETVRAHISELDRHEPKSINSEKYEKWGEEHEELEDLEDEILDLLDEMQP